MITIYTIKTPNAQYCGITEGVPFVDGVAQVEDVNVRNLLVNNYGYIDAIESKQAKEPEEKAPAHTQRKASAK